MAASQTVKQQLLKIAAEWPKDKIRPNHQFGEAIAKIAESRTAWATTSPSAGTQDAKDGEAMIGALTRLLNNRALHSYPLSDKVRKPASSPKHYDNLLQGLKRAEEGEQEPWYKSLFRFRK
ncbi:hypothetical protein P389DRAFT_168818 [Cystobasidium minutum MCA 4210]|uniref:uncharacterized protein n=1 Tax=Cystobasidium minutum MCA 4210 TaxID=1397322 RepID=UPI0034CF34A4|eukprot:jgi/Rhomi1/168818/fgenesh1_kg.3_\